VIKRLIDITAAALGLAVLSPLFLTVAIMIKRDSKGPVFYRQERLGRFGKPFKIYKFRTMVVNADKLGASSTPEDDPRITRVGRFLRTKYQLDEFPQLINVLKGDMSLIGPRPQVPWAVELYTGEERNAILSIRPGMTDHASARFPNEGEILKGSLNPDKDYLEKIAPEKTRLQLEYVKNHSLWVDFKILFRTFRTMF
jgi:lipopolysaccharide/colanic/teichoic acid biosynthesis glycosyltransferase